MIGMILGQYKILQVTAIPGGQATVYKARHNVLKRDVALKVLHPHLITDPDFVQKFEDEGRILAGFSHPKIVTVHDAGFTGGMYWIAMEWLEGQTAQNLVKQAGKLSVDLVVKIAIQSTSALEYAHARNYIHRDIKPANIMILPDGNVKLLDFGIAALVAAGQKAKTRIGTVEYMSYEQFSGQADQRSDIYSLSASLYEMLTGQLPPELALKPLIPPRQLNSTVPPWLEVLIIRSLSFKPEDRPQTFGEFRQFLLTGPGDQETWKTSPPDLLPPMPKGVQPPKSPQALRIRKHISGGIYQNILQWEPSPTPNTQYIIIRKYDSVPVSEHDGIRLAAVSGTIYKDQNPDIGKSACYAVYAVQMYANQVELVSSQAACTKAFRVANVTNLTARRISSRQVELAWKAPPRVHEIRVKRSTMGPARGPHDVNADDVELMKGSQSGIVDRQAPVNIPLTYTIYCRFVDMLDDYGIKTSPGISVDVK